MTPTNHMIDVTEAPLGTLIRSAYTMSTPRGLGFLHATADELSEGEINSIQSACERSTIYAACMDYVRGRACKFEVLKRDGRLYVKNRWYDHSDNQLYALLETVGIDRSVVAAARLAEKEYEDACVVRAVKFLRERGGRYVDCLHGEEDNIPLILGFYAAEQRGRVKAAWAGNDRIFTLPESVAP